MFRRVDSPPSSQVSLLSRTEREQPSHVDGNAPARKTLTRSMAGLSVRASPERAPGVHGMAPRAALPNPGAPGASPDRPQVHFGRNMVHESGVQDHSVTINFEPKARPQRAGKSPVAASSSHAAPRMPAAAVPPSPSRPATASSQPSSPKSGGYFSKLLKGGSSSRPGHHPAVDFNEHFGEFLASNADHRTKDLLGRLTVGKDMPAFRAKLHELRHSVDDPAARELMQKMSKAIDAMKGDYAAVRSVMPAKPKQPAAATRPHAPVRLADPARLQHQEAADKFPRRFNRFMESKADPRFKDHIETLFRNAQIKEMRTELGNRMNLAGSRQEFGELQKLLSALHGLNGDFSGVEFKYDKRQQK